MPSIISKHALITTSCVSCMLAYNGKTGASNDTALPLTPASEAITSSCSGSEPWPISIQASAPQANPSNTLIRHMCLISRWALSGVTPAFNPRMA
ncbi:hypothetical protein D3C81_1478460 [compost metagenome]